MYKLNSTLSLLLTGLAILVSGCVSSIESAVDINEPVESDGAYYEAYKKYTQEAKVISNFEHRYSITATVLAPELRSALGKRYESLFKVQQSVLDDASTKSGFFVTIFSPNRAGYDIEDEVHWTILMEGGETPRRPTVVRRLDDKERWGPFFPEVNQWSKEYLVVFDESLPDLAAAELVKKNSISLIFANADAQVKLTW
jgi:hypothetical protein